MENKEAAPPPTPYYNQSLDLPDWNEGLKVLSPNLPRHTPARTPWKMGPPQVSLQAPFVASLKLLCTVGEVCS